MSAAESEKPIKTRKRPNFTSVFPPAKIKTLLNKEERIGGVRSSASTMTGTSSAIFIYQLAVSVVEGKSVEKVSSQSKLENIDCQLRDEVEPLVIDTDDIMNFIQKQDETYDFLKSLTRAEMIDQATVPPEYFKLYESKMKREKKRSVGTAVKPRKKSKSDGLTLPTDVVGIETIVCEEKGLDNLIDTGSLTVGVMEVIQDEEEYD